MSHPITGKGKVQHLRVLAPLLQVFLVIWSGLVFSAAAFDFGAVQIKEAIREPGLERAALFLFATADAVWIVLLAIQLYLSLVSQDGLNAARKAAGLTLGAAALVTGSSFLTGLPLGPVRYTDVLGIGLGPLPLALLLLWVVVIVASRQWIRSQFPYVHGWRLGLGTGLLALLTDLNLEPIAWRVRAWWVWYPAESSPPGHPPVGNYLTWFLVAALLGVLLPMGKGRPSRVPLIVFALMNGIFLAIHVVRSGAITGSP